MKVKCEKCGGGAYKISTDTLLKSNKVWSHFRCFTCKWITSKELHGLSRLAKITAKKRNKNSLIDWVESFKNIK